MKTRTCVTCRQELELCERNYAPVCSKARDWFHIECRKCGNDKKRKAYRDEKLGKRPQPLPAEVSQPLPSEIPEESWVTKPTIPARAPEPSAEPQRGPKTKVCTRCKERLPATTANFWRVSRNRDGLDSRCARCATAYSRSRPEFNIPDPNLQAHFPEYVKGEEYDIDGRKWRLSGTLVCENGLRVVFSRGSRSRKLLSAKELREKVKAG